MSEWSSNNSIEEVPFEDIRKPIKEVKQKKQILKNPPNKVIKKEI